MKQIRLLLYVAAPAAALAIAHGCTPGNPRSQRVETGSVCSAPAPTGIVPSYSDMPWTVQNNNQALDTLTQHDDLARTGAQVSETILTPTAVQHSQFGYLGSVPVQGKIYAQPLYVEQAAVVCTGSTLRSANIVYVATLNNIVYAIDADSRTICWQSATLGCGQPAAGLNGFNPGGHDAGVVVGIASTPVVDLAKSVLYVVAREWDGTNAHHFVNALDMRTGALVGRAEVVADGVNGCNGHAFNSNYHSNRPGLLLASNKLFLGFGGTIGESADIDYHGWVIGLDVSDPAHPAPLSRAFCATPSGKGAGIWMSGGGLAADLTQNALYLTTGNGAYPAASPPADTPIPGDYPESFVKLSLTDLSVLASYTDTRNYTAPYVMNGRSLFWAREHSDADVGSGGVLLVPGHVVGSGKDGILYNLTQSLGLTNSFQAFIDVDDDEGGQPTFPLQYSFLTPFYSGPNVHGTPVAWDVRARGGSSIYVYGWSEKDALKRFVFDTSLGTFVPSDRTTAAPSNPTPTAHGTVFSANRSMPGGMLSLSASGASSGIVWATVEDPYPNARGNSTRCFNGASCAGCYLRDGAFTEYCDATQGYVAGRLYAFAADDNGRGVLPLLWGDRRSPTPNNLIPRYAKFTPPTLAHGKVVVATGNDEVRFYGLNCGNSSCTPAARHRDDVASMWNDGGTSTFAMYRSQGSSFAWPVQWNQHDGAFDSTTQLVSGDFNGDGIADLAAITNDGGFNTVTVRQSTGSSFITAQWLIRKDPWSSSNRWIAGDFNGDGLTDLARISNESSTTAIYVYLSEGTRLFKSSMKWNPDGEGWDGTTSWVAGDFNGDGITDLAAIWNDGGTNTLTVRQSTRSSFQTAHWDRHDGGWLATTKWLAGDFNGDGLTDIAAAWNDGGFVSLAVFPSTGTSFSGNTQWKVRDGGWGDTVRWFAGDFNGDGVSDVLAVWNDAGFNTLTIRQSTGSSFLNGAHWLIRAGNWSDSTVWSAGSFMR
jgi:hypothetical protein